MGTSEETVGIAEATSARAAEISSGVAMGASISASSDETCPCEVPASSVAPASAS